MRSVKQIKNIKGKIILVRVDFNVPVKNGKILDDFRIKKSIPTLKFLRSKGAKLVLISHLGNGGETLAPVARIVNKLIKIKFISATLGPRVVKAVSDMKNGQIILLENLRNNKGEKAGNMIFAKNLAKLADIYVNEAFPVSHRGDASIVLLPKLLDAYGGLQLNEEIKNLSIAFKKPKHPFLFILGGVKFSTKIPLLKKYFKVADYVFVGGALLNSLLRAKGYNVGNSLVNVDSYGLGGIFKNKKLIFPIDVVVKSGNKLINKKIDEVKNGESILDIGKESIKKIEIYIKKSKLILWNGPLGKYEEGGGAATKKILKLVASSGAISIIGGGDTVSIISNMNIEKKFSFVSTGGGATLDFLANGTLPGIKELK